MAQSVIKKWHEVYVGDEELRFFVGKDKKSGLVRTSYDYRSTSALSKESGLSMEDTERILAKFLKMGVVVASTNKDDHYAYWERVAADIGLKKKKSIAQTDKDKRTGQAMASKP